jgi:hypothetical protein
MGKLPVTEKKKAASEKFIFIGVWLREPPAEILFSLAVLK